MAFDVIPSRIDEEACSERGPAQRAQVLAEAKARSVAAQYPGRWVLGCDTLVVAPDGSLLEKPSDAREAERMLRLQSGGVSVVHSGLTLIAPDTSVETRLSSSRVRFKRLSPDEVTWWIGTQLWRDRSGAFQIDGPGQLMIEAIEGDWTGIVGLPVFLLGEMMKICSFSNRNIA